MRDNTEQNNCEYGHFSRNKNDLPLCLTLLNKSAEENLFFCTASPGIVRT